MSFKRFSFYTSHNATLAIQPRSLGAADLLIAQHAIAEFAPDWSVELHGICTDEASLVVSPEGGDDEIGPSFAISRESYGLRLDQVHWDEMRELGIFPSLSDVLDAIGSALANGSQYAHHSSVTIH